MFCEMSLGGVSFVAFAAPERLSPCAENDKINVLDEPHFGTHILGNYLPFQTSEIP